MLIASTWVGAAFATVEIVRFDRYSEGSTTCGVAEKLQSRVLVANICHESSSTSAIKSFTLSCGGPDGVSFREFATGNCTGAVVKTDDFALNACETLDSTLDLWRYPVVVRDCEMMPSAALTPSSGSTAAAGVGIMKTYFYASTNGACSPFLDTDYIVLGQCESQYGAWAPTGGIGSLRRDCEVKLTSAGTLKYDITLRTWDDSVHDCGESAATAHKSSSRYFGHRNVCWNVGGAGYESYPDFAPAGCYPTVSAAVAAIDPLDPRAPIPSGPTPTSPTPGPIPSSNSQTGGNARKVADIDFAQVIIWSVLGGGLVFSGIMVLIASLIWYALKKQREREGDGRVLPAGAVIGLGVLNPAHLDARADARNGIAVAELVPEAHDFEAAIPGGYLHGGDAVYHNHAAVAFPIIDAQFHAGDDDDDLPVAALVAVDGLHVADGDVVELAPVPGAPGAVAPAPARPSFIAHGAVRRVDATRGGVGGGGGGNGGRDIFVAAASGGSSSSAAPPTQQEEEEEELRAKSAATLGSPIDI